MVRASESIDGNLTNKSHSCPKLSIFKKNPWISCMCSKNQKEREYKNLMLIIFSCRFLKKIGNIKMDTYYDFLYGRSMK